MVRLDWPAVLRLRDLHLRRATKRIAQQARPLRLQVLHEYKRETGVRWDMREQLPERVKTAGRRSHSHYRE